MNRRNLNMLLGNYIDSFAKIQETENYMDQIQKAVDSFKLYVDIEGGDLGEGLAQAAKACEIIFTDGAKQPYEGLVKAAVLKPEEVRDIFKELLEAKSCSMAARQASLFEFRKSLNQLIEENVGGMWKYEQGFKDVLTYQFLLSPEDNYLFRYTDAKKLADCLENPEAVRSGKYFSLQEYYNMCHTIEREIEEKKLLMDYLGDHGYSKALMLADLMTQACRYELYANIKIRSLTRRSSLGKAAREDEIRMRKEEMSEVNGQIILLETELEDARKALDQADQSDTMLGKAFLHKKFGKGKVIEDRGKSVKIEFDKVIKILAMPDSVAKGLLVPCEEDSSMTNAKEKYAIVEKIREIETHISKCKLRREVLERMQG